MMDAFFIMSRAFFDRPASNTQYQAQTSDRQQPASVSTAPMQVAHPGMARTTFELGCSLRHVRVVGQHPQHRQPVLTTASQWQRCRQQA